jgi:hypothetical protein
MEVIQRLGQFLATYKHKYPSVWKTFDEIRARRNSPKTRNWQDWCFCPLDLVRAFASSSNYAFADSSQGISLITGLAAWRATQGIYRFDATVFEAVWKTKISGDLPIEIFYRLPEWCLYVETPGKSLGGTNLNGFFVYLNDSVKRDELRFIFDTEVGLVDFPLYLSKTTILESLQLMISECTYQNKIIGLEGAQYAETLNELAAEIEPLISLTLYICTQLSEITDFENRRKINYSRRQQRIYPPEKSAVWEVAYRLGAAIRKADTDSVNSVSTDLERARPRPYIRRAHWHGFWKGSKRSCQEFELKWLPPMAINTSEDNPLIPIVKKLN